MTDDQERFDSVEMKLNKKELSKDKTSSKTGVNFVVDVDNVGSISDFFEGFEATMSFFVNSAHLDLTKLRYEIVSVSEEDDDDFVLLTEAKNEDAFMIS
jgi:hypothetical protein